MLIQITYQNWATDLQKMSYILCKMWRVFSIWFKVRFGQNFAESWCKKKVNQNVWGAWVPVNPSGDDEYGVQMTRLILSAKGRKTSWGADVAKLCVAGAFPSQNKNRSKAVFCGCRVWSVRYNHFHDQLLLSSSSDSRVILNNIVSLSSEPFGHLDEEDEEDGGQEKGSVVNQQ